MEESSIQNLNPETPLTPKSSRFNMDKHFLPLSILVAAVIIAGTILYTDGKGVGNVQGNISGGIQDVKAPDYLFEDSDNGLGNKDAKVVIVEFSDYQCPFCRSFWSSTLPQIKKEYIDTGKVYFVYRDFPLSIHPMALPTALAAECAGEQGKYWQFHDLVFSEQNKREPDPAVLTTISYTEADLKTWGRQIGLNFGQFESCFDGEKYLEEVNQDGSDGDALGVSGTPGFFVNNHYISGAQPFSVFKTVIDEELNK